MTIDGLTMQTETSSAPHWKAATNSVLAPVFAAKRLGLITDMDGTISHLAETPEAAVVTPRNRQLIGTIVLMLPLVAAISGRSVRDLQARIAVSGVVYIGNHGLERWHNGGRVLNEHVRQYRKALTAALDEIRPHLTIGMWIEDKYATASIHYRLTPRPEKAAETLEPLVREVVTKHGLAMNKGRALYEVRPPIEANKGTALAELVREHELDSIIYIGDDITDVDAMLMARKLRDLTGLDAINVGVVANPPEKCNEIEQAVRNASDVIVSGVHDVEAFLAWLLDALSKKNDSLDDEQTS